MKLRILVLLLLLVIAAPADAASKKSLPDPLKDASVNLYCRLKAGKALYGVSGSGVFISPRGVILTNAHVAQYFLLAGEEGRVTGWCSVRTGSPAKETYTAEVLYLSPSWLSANLAKIAEDAPSGSSEGDFALLYVTGAKKGALPAAFPALSIDTASVLSEGAPVSLSGYPAGSLDFSGMRNKLALVAASSTVENMQGFKVGARRDVFTLASSSAASYGISGAPIVDSGHAVRGIITSKSGNKLRGITATYIHSYLVQNAGVSLSTLLQEEFASRKALTDLLIPDESVAALAKGLRSKNK